MSTYLFNKKIGTQFLFFNELLGVASAKFHVFEIIFKVGGKKNEGNLK